LRKAQNAKEPMPDFSKLTETLAEFFTVEKAKKGSLKLKKICSRLMKNV
jgi:hypothetical protein